MLIFFDTNNPVERGVASMLVKELKAMMHKVVGTNLMYMELEITNKLLSEYEDFIQEAIKDVKAKRGSSSGDEDDTGSKKEKRTDVIKRSGKGSGVNKAVRRKGSSESGKGEPNKLPKGRRGRIRRKQ